MILNADSFFTIGSTHKICQDYSNAGINDYGLVANPTFAAISDGCSGSSNTDIGSRIVVKCAENKTKHLFPEEPIFRKRVLNNIEACCEDIGLNKEALDATLLFLQADLNGYEIRAYGDGSIIKLKHDGTIEFTLIEYPSNAPLYLNYYMYSNYSRFNQYKLKFGSTRNIYKYTLSPNAECKCFVEVDENNEPYIEYGVNDYKVIAVTSDGISSFIKNNDTTNIVNVIDVVSNLMDFKSIKGEFIQRRMNGFKKHCELNSWKHTDDFSIAGISFDLK